MNQTHWGLDRPPFPSGLDPQLFYEGANRREALARLRFLVDHERRLGLVLGETGVGKSLLMELFAEHCRAQGRAVANVDLLGLTSRELTWQLGSQLHAAVRVEDEPLRLFRLLTDRIHENRLQGIATVLLLDDVDRAGPDAINQLLRVARLDNDRLTIVVAGQARQLGRLGSSLLDLVDLRIDLAPWDELDTIGYLQLALVEAGAERPLFEDQALAEIHRLSAGVPRRVNQLAEYALMLGTDDGLELIDAATVHSAHGALKLPIAD